MEKLFGNLLVTTRFCLYAPSFVFLFFLLKAAFQGDGLDIVRLNLSVGGWELPSGRNARGCLVAVKTTAGEPLIK